MTQAHRCGDDLDGLMIFAFFPPCRRSAPPRKPAWSHVDELSPPETVAKQERVLAELEGAS